VTITEALKVLRGAPQKADSFEVTLACGFTSLHLQTFIAAHLQTLLPDRRVIVLSGLFGDLANTVEKAAERQARNLAIAIEWSDLDARLGYRAASRWDTSTAGEIVTFARAACDRLAMAIERAARNCKTVVSLPTLPLPPFFYTPSWQLSDSEAALADATANLGERLTRSGIVVVNQAQLNGLSVRERHDLKSDLLLGIPYALTHSDVLGAWIARLLYPTPPKKGIITDLDDTLWSGLVGELGPEGVQWSLEHHSGLHALYQTLLCSLAVHGVLVGVASKNRLEEVEKTFHRADMLLRPDLVFPMEVHWNAKSASVGRILKTWNIGADAVVFVDDSAMELAEVAAAHPGIECIRFPATDYEAGAALLDRIRDLFGKPRLASEDSIRLSSIRQSAQFEAGIAGSTPETFLQQANGTIHLNFSKASGDARAFELVNKTNQFNLNGIRYTESDWDAGLTKADTRLMVASYEDRFGLLGKIIVTLGTVHGERFRIKTWVMSCRAFSRRIEYACLRICFERYQVREIEFEFLPTSKNAPLQEFLASLFGSTLEMPLILTRDRFEEVCPPLYHTIDATEGLDCDGQGSGSFSKML
jgi:FkbH-like protein